MNRIDVHNHFLPATDDGCSSIADSLECIRTFITLGYNRFFLTPHTGALDYGDITPALTRTRVEQLRKTLAAENIHVELRPGGELRLSPEILKLKDLERIPTYGHNTNYCLADIWEPDWPTWADACVDWLQNKGLTVILAHPERMAAVRRKPALMDRLAQRGLLFQGNLGPLGGSESKEILALSERFLKEGRYFMLGSDCHRPDHLFNRVRGLRHAVTLVGTDEVNRLTITNPGILWV